VERIIAHTRKITETKGRRFEELNVKLVPRLYLYWNRTPGKQHWPADLHAANREVLAGAAEIQEAFGCHFVLDSASYPLAVHPGKQLTVKLTVRNTGRCSGRLALEGSLPGVS
jgi:hypothetical protein